MSMREDTEERRLYVVSEIAGDVAHEFKSRRPYERKEFELDGRTLKRTIIVFPPDPETHRSFSKEFLKDIWDFYIREGDKLRPIPGL